MSAELFVYWHVNVSDTDVAIAAAHSLQFELRARFPGLTARLYRRPDEREGRVTVMEIYAARDGLSQGMQDAISLAAERSLGSWLQGQRHVESFVSLHP